MPDTAFMPDTDLSRWLGNRAFADAKAEFDEKGYIIFETALSQDELEDVREALAPHLGVGSSRRDPPG